LDVPTRSNRAANPAAVASVLFGVAALAAWPAAVGVARYSRRVDLVWALVGAVGAGLVLALLALLLGRRAYWRIQRTLGRSRGRRAARAGRLLGAAGVCVAITGALALGFFGLLELFAR
jgi:hypothetical protein